MQQTSADSYPQHQSPQQAGHPGETSPYQSHSQGFRTSFGVDGAGAGAGPGAGVGPAQPFANGSYQSPQAAPVRPRPPFEQFTDHMTPQLQADSYPPDEIIPRIKEEWANLSSEDRGLWEQRYEDQMMEYGHQMDLWKRGQRRSTGVNGTPAQAFSPAAR